jgi:SecD/SecF fusion protein
MLITLGFLAVIQSEISIGTVAALLTVVGYSLNDTIVVFDRIRERTRGTVDRLRETVNQAILETVPRTLNTGLGAMFILAALAVVGGKSLEDFALALLMGLTLGVYSTVFTAAPLAIWAEERWPPSEPSPEGRVVDPYAAVPVGGRTDGP